MKKLLFLVICIGFIGSLFAEDTKNAYEKHLSPVIYQKCLELKGFDCQAPKNYFELNWCACSLKAEENRVTIIHDYDSSPDSEETAAILADYQEGKLYSYMIFKNSKPRTVRFSCDTAEEKEIEKLFSEEVFPLFKE